MGTNDLTSTNNHKKKWLNQCRGAWYFLSNHQIIEGDTDISCQSTVISADSPTGQATENTQAELLNSPESRGHHSIPQQGQQQGQAETKTAHETFNFKRVLNMCEICMQTLEQCICIKDLESVTDVL